jgi:hypothetical protein
MTLLTETIINIQRDLCDRISAEPDETKRTLLHKCFMDIHTFITDSNITHTYKGHIDFLQGARSELISQGTFLDTSNLRNNILGALSSAEQGLKNLNV